MDWHQLVVRCSALEMYLLLTPVDYGKSIEMTLFDIKGRDIETQTFPYDTSPKVLWQTADEWVTWHTLSRKRRLQRQKARKSVIDEWKARSRLQWAGGLILLVLTATLFAVSGYLLFDAQRAKRLTDAGSLLISTATWSGWADMMVPSILIGGSFALIVGVVALGMGWADK
jgi:hypothetical protein